MKDWVPRMEIPEDIRLLWFIDGGFYLHSIYATIFMDAFRKDFAVMLAHHVLTVGLLCLSYAFRFAFLVAIYTFESTTCS